MIAPYQAVILVAGRGSRLSTETSEIPKALLPIGRRAADDPTETTFLRRQIDVLRDCGVEQVVVVVGYQRERIIAELHRWAPWAQVVVNPSADISTSGSLHSFQYAVRSEFGVLDGTKQTVLMDGDIVYQRGALQLVLNAPEVSASLICKRVTDDDDSEEVLVYGTAQRPRFIGKALTDSLVDDATCLGEATGIIKLAPSDHPLVREIINWMLGDPDAPEGSARHAGFGPARRGTEHEELSQRLMQLGKMHGVIFGDELLFMEVDTPDEYARLRESFYPRLLKAEKVSSWPLPPAGADPESGKRSSR
ncbi:MAG: NTP transferase domain-containing protein [Myxococcota bacterium]